MYPARPPRSPGLSRPPPTPPSRTLPPPTNSPPPQPPSSSSHPHQTSLPSIRQLYLSQPPVPHLPPSSAPAPYPYPPSLPYSSAHPPTHVAHQGPQRDAEIYGTAESEVDDVEHQGPPKKKRRRQALSCTECKRRKIKCDRSQPCAPCTRRGEQAKCQWHVVEPIEKYVTRAEYDDLRARFDQLSALVNRLLNHLQTPASALGASSEAVSTYVSGVSYHPLMPPPHNYPQQPSLLADTAAVQAPQSLRYGKSEEVSRPTGSSHGVGSSPAAAATVSPSLSATRPSMTMSPTTTAAIPKSSPLSLAAITSPFTPSDHAAQSKNYHAQTFILGERLRLGSQVLGDPVTLTMRRRRRQTHRRCIMIGIHPSISTRLRPASVGLVI